MALTPVSETETLKKYSKPPGDPPGTSSGGTVSVFPNAPLNMPVETFRKAMERREQNRNELLKWLDNHLLSGIDFGRIHIVEQCPYAIHGNPNLCEDASHWSDPILWKSGAERILGVLGLTVHFPSLHQYEMACCHKHELSAVVLKCELKTNNGTVVAEGSGARHIKQDNFNLNTTMKMAAKSAMIDATIRVAGLTSMFRQTSNYSLTRVGVCKNNNLPGMPDCNHSDRTNKSHAPTPNADLITVRQKEFILKIASRKGITLDGLKKECQTLFNKSLDSLSKVDASKFIQHLKG